ncbi:hypothetical protein HZH68_016860 [Vespula germanica]|uniref:Uncharacterized protein n=1 Tax=Vespula germanica TaxID=30212 RepID=A0A834J1A5_VESGE|nr:hypothetical protein HZH68_016860 [Vespula germanica]
MEQRPSVSDSSRCPLAFCYRHLHEDPNQSGELIKSKNVSNRNSESTKILNRFTQLQASISLVAVASLVHSPRPPIGSRLCSLVHREASVHVLRSALEFIAHRNNKEVHDESRDTEQGPRSSGNRFTKSNVRSLSKKYSKDFPS